MSQFKERVTSFGREIWAFVSSRVFLKNFGIMAGLGIALLGITFLWMGMYTRHGESLQVEDYTEMNIQDALRKARARNLRIVVMDSIYIIGRSEANVVLQQNPKPFSRVKENRTIYVTVTRSEGDPRLLPKLTGRDEFNQYRRALKAIEVTLEIKERVYRQKLAANTILSLEDEDGKKIEPREVNEGIKVLPGSTLYATITERGSNRVYIPNLVCQRYEYADFLIKSAELHVGIINRDATVNDDATAYVYRQVPAYREDLKLRVGEQINLYLTQNRPEDCE